MFDQHCEICNSILISNKKDIEEYETIFYTTGERDGYELFYCVKCNKQLNKDDKEHILNKQDRLKQLEPNKKDIYNYFKKKYNIV